VKLILSHVPFISESISENCIDKVMEKNKLAPFLWPTVYICVSARLCVSVCLCIYVSVCVCMSVCVCL